MELVKLTLTILNDLLIILLGLLLLRSDGELTTHDVIWSLPERITKSMIRKETSIPFTLSLFIIFLYWIL